MDAVLNLLGEELATSVIQDDLPTTNLDIDMPRVAGWSFLDTLLLALARAMNSLFFVGNDVNYLNSYINALAVLMDKPDEFAARVSKAIQVQKVSDNTAKIIFQRLVGTRLHTLHVDRLFQLFDSGLMSWNAIFDQMIEETRDRHYFLVIDHIEEIFHKGWQQDDLRYPASIRFYFATRGIAKLTFIAPLNWPNYAKHIEGPMVRHRRPFFFTPRPTDLSYSPIVNFEQPPDSIFDFGKQPN